MKSLEKSEYATVFRTMYSVFSASPAIKNEKELRLILFQTIKLYKKDYKFNERMLNVN